MLHSLRVLSDRLYWGITTLFSIQEKPHCLPGGFDDGEHQDTAYCINWLAEPIFFFFLLPIAGEPRVQRYAFISEDKVASKQIPTLKELPAREVHGWAHMILETGR